MANVLIGIIGVILFIGLALAGALILGSDFQTASSSGQAAATVSQLQQVQAAIEMYRLKTGRRQIQNQNTAFLVPRFLKVAAVNPTPWGRSQANMYWRGVMLNNDINPDATNESGGQIAQWAQIMVGQTSDNRARDICLAIEEGQGRSTIPTSNVPTTPIGCNSVNGSYYIAYARFGA